ncbi:MAG TPA: porin [Roseiarcus sp.]
MATGLAAGPACAGDVLAPPEPAKAPNDPHCSALGEGFFAVTGSDACIRISGYVAAGAEFGGGLRPGRAPAPFDANATPAVHTYTGVSVDAQFDTPMGPGLIHVDGGRGNFGP